MHALRTLGSFGLFVFVPLGMASGCALEDDPGTVATGGAGGTGGSGGSTVAGTGGTTSGGMPGSGGAGMSTGGTVGGKGGSGTGGVSASGGAPMGGSGNPTGGTGGGASGAGGSTGGATTGGSAGASSGMGGSVTTGGGAGAGGSGGGSAGGASGGSGGATPSSGCGKAPPASNRYTIDVDGTMREYILLVPSNYEQTRPYRLVFTWHPLGGSAQQVAGNGNSGYYGLASQANGSAIFVSPEGLPFQGESLGWGNNNGRDIAFLEAMLARFKSEMCIDEDRIFSTGFSFGGMMSFAVGCAGLARAIAPMAGNSQVSGCTNGTTPVAVMGFHGTEDTVVSIDGGRTGRDRFVDRNGCMDQTMPATSDYCSGLNQNNQPCSCTSHQGCQAGYPVTWCEFNGGHTPAPNSAATIWNFFAQF